MALKPTRSSVWLGKYISLALALPASVMGGYLLGAIADHYLHLPILRALGMLLGLVAGISQIMHELSRDEKKKGPPL
jgi:F0F1-type ATP synthase assembly protein I